MAVIRDTQNVVPGPSTRGGWVRPLSQIVDQLEADVTGLKERLRNGLRGGVPAAYSAKRVFLPDQQATVDGAAWGIAQPLNYVLRDGQTYDVPVVFPGPGVFLARKMSVTVTQRIFCPHYGNDLQIAMSSVDMPVLGQVVNPTASTAVNSEYFLDGVRLDWTYKMSLFPTLPSLPVNAPAPPLRTGYVIKPGVNYVWNILDSKSGAWLSSDFISHLALMPRTFQPVVSNADNISSVARPFYWGIAQPIYDGSFFYFDAPWLVERDGQLNFRFRPHTPVLQYDSSVNLATDLGTRNFSFDDRQNGLRSQAVTVQVEIHGRRYESVQDLKHAGALSR